MWVPSSPVIGCAADIAKHAFSEGELTILFMHAGVDEFVPNSWYGKAQLLGSTLRAAKREADDGSERARDGLGAFVRLVAERAAPADEADPVAPGTPIWRLREALRSDGFDLSLEYETTTGSWGHSTSHLSSVRLLPLEDSQAPLSDEITALEHAFDSLGLSVARNCYRQAVDCLVDQRFEAANGQLRAMLEAVLVHFAVAKGFSSTRQGDGGRALSYLMNSGHLPDRDGGWYIRGLWSVTHTNGPHPGTSDAGEARFRLQAMTSAARYLIDRFGP